MVGLAFPSRTATDALDALILLSTEYCPARRMPTRRAGLATSLVAGGPAWCSGADVSNAMNRTASPVPRAMQRPCADAQNSAICLMTYPLSQPTGTDHGDEPSRQGSSRRAATLI